MSRQFGFKVRARIVRAAAAFLEQPVREVQSALDAVLERGSQMQVGEHRIIAELAPLPGFTKLSHVHADGSLQLVLVEPDYPGLRGLVLRVRRGRDGLQPYSVTLVEQPADPEDLLEPIEWRYEVQLDRAVPLETYRWRFRREGMRLAAIVYRHPGEGWRATMATSVAAGEVIDLSTIGSPDVICDIDRLPLEQASIVPDPTDASRGIADAPMAVTNQIVEVDSPRAGFDLLVAGLHRSDRLAADDRWPAARLPRN